MKNRLSLGYGVVGVVLLISSNSNVMAERLGLEKTPTGFNLRLDEVEGDGPAALGPRFRAEGSLDLQTWVPVGELLRTGAGSHALEVSSEFDMAGFYRVQWFPVSVPDGELAGEDLASLVLRDADFRGADLRYADLSGADLRGANLTGADLRGADLRFADLQGAVWQDADFRGANLIGANLGSEGGVSLPEGALFVDAGPNIDPDSAFPEIGDGAVFAPPAPPLPTFDAGGGGGALVAPARGNLGFAVGGANDVGNFRQNIENEFLPLVSDITYEGLFFDYFFETGLDDPCETLFCPSYAQAVSFDPISEQAERYLSVGLNSGISEADFERKQLNLTVVLDVSGSMNSPFNRFFYDGGIEREVAEEERDLLKIDVGIEAVTALMDHLEPEDRIGIVTFNSESRVVQPLARVENLDLDEVRRSVQRLRAFSGTNMSAGMRAATNQYDALLEIDPTVSENRIIFVTDAMPNQGETTRSGLVGMIESNAEKRLYATVIGVGVDFNTDLIESITKNRGANYHSVHSPSQFVEQLDDHFDFMVTPLVFDLHLALDGTGWSIAQVYGSPEADQATGEVFRVNTLFPSPTRDGETRGGLILIKLNRNPDVANRELTLSASYENRVGETFTISNQVEFLESEDLHYDNEGIRKGVLLARYAELLKNWVFDERASYEDERPIVRPLVYPEWGIPILPPWPDGRLGQWERRSSPLFVAHRYREVFDQFRAYFASEREVLGDEDLDQELSILDRLASDPDVVVEE